MSLEPPKKTDEIRQRLIVLFALHHLGSCTDIQLTRFLAEMQLMNYFDMMFAMTELCAQQYVLSMDENGNRFFSVSPEGEKSLRLFESRIPYSTRALIQKNAPEYIVRFTEEGTAQSAYSMTEDGCELRLTALDGAHKLMELHLFLPDRALVAPMQEAWQKKAHEIYAFLISTLTGGGNK